MHAPAMAPSAANAECTGWAARLVAGCVLAMAFTRLRWMPPGFCPRVDAVAQDLLPGNLRVRHGGVGRPQRLRQQQCAQGRGPRPEGFPQLQQWGVQAIACQRVSRRSPSAAGDSGGALLCMSGFLCRAPRAWTSLWSPPSRCSCGFALP